ncbi:LCP family protein [Candidatus Parcubacteria bacterium]|nr:LCP family protein [Candidatus Parcubacteria bacterium]
MLEKIDLLKYQKKRHRKKKVAGSVMIIAFLILGTLFVSFKLFYVPKELNAGTGFFASLSHLVISPEKDITAGKKNINILLLGMGGIGHEGPFLTDTMLIASIDKDNKRLAITSIPRDLLVETYKFGKQKINHLNSYAEVEKASSGGEFTKSVLEELLHIPIDYYVRFDFEGFKSLIDAVGGLDVDVPRTFTDPLFPREEIGDGGGGTITVTFKEGYQHMDGETALTYARSRHGNNGEGNDFARSRRQEQIILELKNKILSSETLFSLSTIKNILKTLDDHVVTDVSAWEALSLANTYKNLDISSENIKVNVIANGPSEPLYSDYYNGQYVLLPKKQDWSDLRTIANNPFDDYSDEKYTGTYNNTEDILLVILNGTSIGGLAGGTALTLEDFGYKVKDIGNSPQKDFEKNVIYAINVPEEKKDALMEIKRILDANVAQTIPDWLKEKIDMTQNLTL